MALLTKAQAKSYCRVEADYTDEDSDIEDLLAFSNEYLLKAGIKEIDSPTYRLAQKILIDDRYTHRGSKEPTPKAQSSINCLILQLQNSEYAATVSV